MARANATGLYLPRLLLTIAVVMVTPAGWSTEPLPPGHPPIPNPPASWPGSSLTGPAGADPREFYLETLHPQIQLNCVACHRAGGTAEQSGARLILSDSADESHEAFAGFLALDGVDPGWVLGKVTGQFNHGGGPVTTEGSSLYQDLDQYLSLLTGTSSTVSKEDFWRGTNAEPPEITLRRASLLFGGKVASAEAITAAKQSEAALKEQILASMDGEGFHEFITTGANDRLLVSGLLNGLDFNFDRGRYPNFVNFRRSLPEYRPEEFNTEEYWDYPFLTQNDASWNMDWSIVQEPLELIAHVIMTDKPYRQILTADYTMVNMATDPIYRADTGFSENYTDEKGFYDRSEFRTFRPGTNNGHVPNDDEYERTEDDEIVNFSGYQEWPHAGLLSTHAWLVRYPSTDTNRNRARARWTYFHFLGIDIEKSAPRTTDPVALADTNNPTMNNPACTVCHENLDPVAGAYQSFGDRGTYLDQYGGMDSLPDSYKYPEWFGGESGSTDYQEGDTWYRDMRAPGFDGETAKGQRDSLQWLGYRISRDPRFAAATVRFWWPAIFGADPLTAPEDPSGPDYDQRVKAFNAQDELIQELAGKFEASGFNAKSLFADMVLSKWYRHSEVTSSALAQARNVELATVGRGRLLTPEELDRKNLAVFGRTWRQQTDGANWLSRQSALFGGRDGFAQFYGGIDGATVTQRNRQLTPLMSNVMESMATELACLVVTEQFALPADERTLFKRVDRSTQAGSLSAALHELPGWVTDYHEAVEHSITEQVTLVGGAITIGIDDLTPQAYGSTDSENTNADLTVIEIVFRKNGYVTKRISGNALPYQSSFKYDTWQDDDGNEHPRGQLNDGTGGWQLHENAWISIDTSLPEGDYEVEWRLGTTLFANNVNEAMVVQTTITARENIDKTESMQMLRAELQTLYLNGTSRALTEETTDSLLDMLLAHAEMAAARSHRADDEGQCDLWHLRRGDTTVDWNADPDGMMRAWTMVLHSVMTSYAYLHD